MSTARSAPRHGITVGDIRLTYLPDGVIRTRPQALYGGAEPGLWEEHKDLLDADGFMVMSVGSVLISTESTHALVDLGYGPRAVDVAELSGGALEGSISGGRLPDSLAQQGLTPDDIDAVILTHLHDDHIGWLAAEAPDGPQAVFPRARHYLGRDEWAHWERESNREAHPAAPTVAQLTVLRPRAVLVDDGDSPLPGVTVLATPGHTPGHLCVLVTSRGERCLITGDAIHNPLEFAHRELVFTGEADPVQARASRRRIHSELALPRTSAAVAHASTTVFGRVTSPGTWLSSHPAARG